jgi:hypothetical protein
MPFRRLPWSWRLVAGFVLAWWSAGLLLADAVHAQSQPSLDQRPYDAGPLTADDFRGTPDPAEKLVARTVTAMRYKYEYSYVEVNRRVTVSLTSIELTAYICRDQSWNRFPKNVMLLDHEQGHADNAQIHTLEARIAFARDIGSRQGVKSSAGTLEGARAGLEKRIKERMADMEKRVRESDANYDRDTKNGTAGTQAEWRRVQQETLARLEAEWEKLRE